MKGKVWKVTEQLVDEDWGRRYNMGEMGAGWFLEDKGKRVKGEAVTEDAEVLRQAGEIIK